MSSKLFLSVLALAFSIAPGLMAQQKKNPGPADFEIKFKLPAPKALSADEALKTFAIQEGYRIELVAAEPLIEAPVAISFDDQGRLYVVEMRGYMHDIQGSTETQPTGRISLLEDTDGDGQMDKSTVFLDNLVMPRSVMAVNGGALVAEPPNLFFCKDTDGDGKADTKEIVASDYGTFNGQHEHMANTPVWAMDNWIWSAKYNTKFRLTGGIWQKGAGLGRGQYGLCQDDVGRLFYNYNSDFLRADFLQGDALSRNPQLRTATSINAKVVKDQTVWPSHPTPGVNRGYGTILRADGTMSSSTATCGALIYRGNALPADAKGNAFIPEPAGNLVKRFKIAEKGGVLTGENVLKNREFLTSTDERFRPVQATDGPDGALYIVDMYRGIIQHAGFLTHYLIANIEDRKLAQPIDMGRIWRIVPDNGKEREAKRQPAVKLPADSAGRVAALKHDNGWVRDTAQRLLVESGDTKAVPALVDLLNDATSSPLTRLHALWTLEGLGSLNAEVLRRGLKDPDVHVRSAAVRLSGFDLLSDLRAMKNDSEPLVVAQLAIKFTSIPLPDALAALADLMAGPAGKQPLAREGALSGLRGREAAFALLLAERKTDQNAANLSPVLEELAKLVASANKAGPFEELLTLASSQPVAGAAQIALLKGLAELPKDKKLIKLIWFEGEPASIKSMSAAFAKQKSGKKFLSSIDQRIAWPGKPGAPPPPKIVPLTAAQQEQFEKGKMLYTINCAACHQAHGMGLDGLAPTLVDSEWVLGNPDIPARIIMQGVAGPIKVGPQTFDLAMPPLMHLSDEDIAAVVTYIRREWEHTASPIDTSFVAKVREKHKSRSAPWTAAELKKK
ncbi:c-type cytochrome [Phragmitibacter flavus]|uniref:C-type cytochrome n=1 Tax=Phragmitibacter flavus TaxID=2576071 RepID=A0A5R8KJK2_9BACT|nr:PVC-type heme-binding CxxCH protein [Phragmitibacter flavus]TLD72503.1 c-type cytochrome [Phragmitibacter flavus]